MIQILKTLLIGLMFDCERPDSAPFKSKTTDKRALREARKHDYGL